MCGFGEKVDRRPLDPPPIIQLEIKNTAFSDENSYLYNPYYFMYASLIAPESEEELHLLRDGKTRSTTGSIVSSLYRLKDLDNKDGAFFVFPDLSVRMEGTYRLKFSLFEIINTEIYHCTSICSDAFNVYPAKKFPGMEESTFLSRTFAEQGLKIRIRKELRMRKGRGIKGNHDIDESAEHLKKRGRKKGRRVSVDGSENASESGYSDEPRPESSQRRRTSNKSGSSKRDSRDKQAHGPPYPHPGYDRCDPSRPMGHPDPRYYSHMPHDPSGHPYPPHYGMPPKYPYHGDPYSGMPPHGYPIPPPHYDPSAPYPPPLMGPPGSEHEGQYPVPYPQRPMYPPPPHMYNPREHDPNAMDWHHRDYRSHPGYGPPPGAYLPPPAHPYDDSSARGPGGPPPPPAQVPGGGPQGQTQTQTTPGEHGSVPPAHGGPPPPVPYYPHPPHPGAPPMKHDPPRYAHSYGFGQGFHVSAAPGGDSVAGGRAEGTPGSHLHPAERTGPHGGHLGPSSQTPPHGMYPPHAGSGHWAPPGYYGSPYPPGSGAGGGGPPHGPPGAMPPYPYPPTHPGGPGAPPPGLHQQPQTGSGNDHTGRSHRTGKDEQPILSFLQPEQSSTTATPPLQPAYPHHAASGASGHQAQAQSDQASASQQESDQ
ncbi:hypothetical protein HDU86_005273 [Geranomyces michiganensis]|nr:hypothetical protein HDU86_005273 [Geranomyces michiganensis]